MITATISKIGSPREWTGQHGKVYYTDVVLSDGVTVSLGRKSPNGIKAGDPVTYDIDGNGKAKEVRQNVSKGSSYRPQGSTASFALSYAKDIAVANITKSDKPLDMEALAAKVLATAEKFNQWLKDNS